MQEIHYKELLNLSSMLIFAIDADSHITYCGDNALEFSGYTQEELLGTSIHTYMNDSDIEKLTDAYIEMNEDETSVKGIEHNFITKSGRIISVSLNAIPILDENNNMIGLQGTLRNITREKEAENFLKNVNKTLKQKVEQGNKLNQEKEQQLISQSRLAQMGEMISMIAHQWRQPLGAISATTINMQMKFQLGVFDLSNDESKQECEQYIDSELENINAYVKTLTNTIDDFRNFYKPNKKVIKTKLEDVCEKALNIIKAALINENINIIRQYNSNEEVRVYENEMMQVILNIFQNAHDNFKEKNIENPHIIIKTFEKQIEIIDNGGGIPEDIIDKIFDPYFSTKQNKNGTGLGLYMSKTIIEEHHNGVLSVENTGDGVCFRITVFW